MVVEQAQPCSSQVNIVDDMPVGNLYYQIYGDSACPNDEVLFVAENSGRWH